MNQQFVLYLIRAGLFAQIDDHPATPEFDPNFGQQSTPFWIDAVWSVAYFAYFALWVWMIVECLRKDPDRYLWIWVIFIFQPFGTLIYFFVRWLPNNDVRAPKLLRNLARGSELTRLETAAQQIGNAHQFIELGDALRDVGHFDRAGAAYAKALQKDPDSVQALWGAALVDMHGKDFNAAEPRLEKLLGIDPQYKFGDVSLAYGKTLYELGKVDAAQAQLENHIKRWRHPESLYVLATIEAEAGNIQESRQHLQAMLMDINSSPRAIARKHGIWRSRAKKMLRKLPRPQ